MEIKNNIQAQRILRRFVRRYMPWHEYHNADHALEVECVAENLAHIEGVQEEKIRILKAAAKLHDIVYKDEDASALLALNVLPRIGFTHSEAEEAAQLIRATKIPTNPSNLLEQIICDADCYNLGYHNFFEKGELLRQEFRVENKRAWYESSLNFLDRHVFYSSAAKSLFDSGLYLNRISLRDKIEEEKYKEAAEKWHGK